MGARAAASEEKEIVSDLGSHVAVDFETVYTGPTQGVSIKTLGAWHYCRHPRVGGDPEGIHTVSLYAREGSWVGRPWEFDWSSIDGRQWVSHNAAFDREVYDALREFGHHGNPYVAMPSRWDCTANLVAYLGSKRDLGSAAHALLGLDVSKDVRKEMMGKTLREMVASGMIREVDEYALRDSEVCWLLWERYASQMPEIEHRISQLTMTQTRRGIPCNADRLESGVRNLERAMWDAAQALPWARQGAEGEDRILSDILLAAECRKIGIDVPKSTAEDSPDCALWEAKHPHVPWVQARRRYRKANLLRTKLQKMRSRLRLDSRLAYGVKYFGAHTGRWTGDAGFNVHGFGRDPLIIRAPEGWEKPEDLLDDIHSGKVDLMGCVERGHAVDMRACVEVVDPSLTLGLADLSQIEPRVLHWLAGNWNSLELIRQGMSVYEVHARQAMGWEGGVMKKEDPTQYRMAKDRVLGLGYGCGAPKFRGYVLNSQGIDIGVHGSKRIVNEYRVRERNIKALWDSYHALLVRSVADGEMTIELPSWGSLVYRDLKKKTQDQGEMPQMTATVGGGKTSYLWGSKIVENIVQRVARDVFCECMLRVEESGIPTFLSVHDEMLSEVPVGTDPRELEEIIAINPEWMPDVPLASEAICSPYYLK